MLAPTNKTSKFGSPKFRTQRFSELQLVLPTRNFSQDTGGIIKIHASIRQKPNFLMMSLRSELYTTGRAQWKIIPQRKSTKKSQLSHMNASPQDFLAGISGKTSRKPEHTSPRLQLEQLEQPGQFTLLNECSAEIRMTSIEPQSAESVEIAWLPWL